VRIIATDNDLRKSIAFVLTTEGFVVTSFREIPERHPAGYDATVLDHRAARGRSERSIAAFCKAAAPIVLLGGTPSSSLVQLAYRFVRLPTTGNEFVEAVKDATGLNGRGVG
jgi:hypothetical protein